MQTASAGMEEVGTIAASKATGFTGSRLLIVAFEGWNDAGEAATGAARVITDHLALREIGEVDPEEYFDYQFTRPTIAFDDDGKRRLSWPTVRLLAPDAEHALPPQQWVTGSGAEELHLLIGTEPARRWQNFTTEIIDAILDESIEGIVFLGAMLADAPHSRPLSVFASSDDPQVRSEFGIERPSYEGPVGILSVLSDAAARAGIPSLSLWASVPHYVHNAPSPKAVLALLSKLDEILGITVPKEQLAAEAAAWEAGVDALAAEDEDMAAYITQLEQARDTVDSPEASGEAIAQEFERYLRKRGDGPGEEPWRPPGS